MTKRKKQKGGVAAAPKKASNTKQPSGNKPRYTGSNVRLTPVCGGKGPLPIRGDPLTVPANIDKGVVVDPFENIEVNQYLNMTDNTDMVVQAKAAVTKEELSVLTFSDPTAAVAELTTKAVHRVLWHPPWLESASLKQSADQRGVFSDVGELHVTFRNMLSQEITITANSPRGTITSPDTIYFRDYQRKITLGAGQTRMVKVHWGDQANIKCPLFATVSVKDTSTATTVSKHLCFEVLDYMVEYPKLDRESNSAYDKDTEVCAVSFKMHYLVNRNPPPDAQVKYLQPFYIAGSNKPQSTLFSLTGQVNKTRRVRDINQPNWIPLNESTRPFVAVVREGDEANHRLKLCGVEAGWTDALPLQLGVYRSSRYRVWVPGLGTTRGLDPHPSTKHAWATVNLFGYDSASKAWYLWDEEINGPQLFGDKSDYDPYNDLSIVPAGMVGMVFDIGVGNIAGNLEITAEEVIAFLSTVTKVISVASSIVGLFA